MAKKKDAEPATTATVPAEEPETATPEPEEAKQGKPCPECGKKVGSRARTCPFCSAVIPPKEKKAGTGTRTASNAGLTLEGAVALFNKAKRIAEGRGETVAEYLATVDEVLASAEEFGSVENFRDCLNFWVEASASK